MDTSEILVKAYLKSCGFAEIEYEPDGNVPPDFLCDKQVAVEVRRLNQNHNDGQGSKGLEETAIPLWEYVHEFLLKLGPPTYNQSCFVFYRFSRPVPKWRALRLRLKAELEPFMADRDAQPFEMALDGGFKLEVFPASEIHPTFFVPGGHTDRESGGFLITEMETNLKLCILEKTMKIAKVKVNYAKWWLVLSDKIGYGLDEFDQQIFRRQVKLIHGFDKIVLLDPRDHNRAFEI